MDTLKIKLLRENAALPRRATAGSAGCDLCAATNAPLRVEQGAVTAVPTGVAIQLEQGYAALVMGRSGLGIKHGVVPANAVGLIDSDYRGELVVGLTCHCVAGYTIQPGERIAQLVVVPVCMAQPQQVAELNDTVRGTGGFGSTGG